ncbi:MAG: hypothetical protein AAGA30_19910, partial [Planctomycetota bacterium]
MRKIAGLFVASFLLMTTGQLLAQDSSFSANGVTDRWFSNNAPASDNSLFGFHKGDRATPLADRTGFQMPKFDFSKWKTPTWEMPKFFQGKKFPNPIQMSDTGGGGILSSFPKFELPKRDPTQPSFFQRMN